MSIFETFATNKAAEVEGVWKTFPANKDGTIPGFQLRRMSKANPEYQKKLEHYGKVFKTEINLDIFTEEQAFEPMLEVFTDTILVNWRNLQDKEGNEITYTTDAAKKLMRDLPDLYELLREYASRLSTFRESEISANVGN